MNELGQELQDRLEQLEAGLPLAQCLEGLPEQDAAALRLAAEMRRLPMAGQDAAAAAGQRARLMAAAGRTPSAGANGHAGPIDWRQLSQRLAGMVRQRAAVGLAVVTALILMWVWVGSSREQQPEQLAAPITQGERAAQPEPAEAAAPETAAAAPETAAASPAEEAAAAAAGSSPDAAAAAEAAAPAERPMSATFLPVLSSAMLTSPGRAAAVSARGIAQRLSADGLWESIVPRSTSLAAGDRVRTGELSSLVLAFYDGSVAAIGANTELTIDTLHAQLPEDGLRTVVLTQWQGDSDHQVAFRNDAGSRYQVNTPYGTGIARGTQFHVRVRDEQSSYTVSEGRVDVSNAGATMAVVAGQLSSFSADSPPSYPEFLVTGVGEVTQTGDTWIVAGQPFDVDDDTEYIGDPGVGDLVYVEGRMVSGGNPLALRIELLHQNQLETFSLKGVVDEINDDFWIVAGQRISVTEGVGEDDLIEVGDLVHVTGYILPESGSLVADDISLVEDEHGLWFEFVGVVESKSDTAWTISGIEITVDGESEIDERVEPGMRVKVEGWILENGDWLAHEIKLAPQQETFEFTGIVTKIDPWIVSGIGFETRGWTIIESGIKLNSTVRVSGVILEDGSWIASRIELIDDSVMEIVFVGTVDSVGPDWVISGLPIDTDGDTKIDDGIVVTDLVKVTVWIKADGSWLARRIELISSEVDDNCVALTAVITGINDDQIFLSNGSTVLLSAKIVVDGELRVGSVVTMLACVNDEGKIEIVSIIVIYTPPPAEQPPADDPDQSQRVEICHKPGTPAEQSKSLPAAALGGHLGHGDTLGSCP